jgi:hypothetical protein
MKKRSSHEKPGTLRRRFDRERLARLQKLKQPQVTASEDDFDDDLDEEEDEAQIQEARARVFQSRRTKVGIAADEDDLDDDDEEEEEYDIPRNPIDELISILKALDDTRSRLDSLQVNLSQWLERYPSFEGPWRKFLQSGGLTLADFHKFRQGQMRPRIIRGKRHLRLISTRKFPVKIKKSGHDGEAA